jgi:hypothetical protein
MSVTMTSGACSRASLRASRPLAGLGDDGDVGLEVEERGEGSSEHGLVFGEEDADRRRGLLAAGRHEGGGRSVPANGVAERQLDDQLGSRDRRLARVRARDWPPSDSMRSRMPRRPLPSRAMACSPLSSTTRRRRAGRL